MWLYCQANPSILFLCLLTLLTGGEILKKNGKTSTKQVNPNLEHFKYEVAQEFGLHNERKWTKFATENEKNDK
ncbi:small, acid-soluble spore protein, alpha/beta type [Thermanaerosceptrum fracticalcis]|uniref:Small, acid-soluble spore protein, alpha/beta type n=1 Tax=Thermanaerosceptrum fracticalcis TaxID=1712410 RepID=A0A7G6E1L1_THEFR|nr:small, acid-soluble spore protein, alpha/beta type [Thermanaerosceptrum fracticalcis]